MGGALPLSAVGVVLLFFGLVQGRGRGGTHDRVVMWTVVGIEAQRSAGAQEEGTGGEDPDGAQRSDQESAHYHQDDIRE